MNFCSHCGQPVTLRVPEGDHRPRHVCTACGTVHYQNPKIVAGCVPEHEGRILLCRRAIEPRLGYWTIPAGFMENGETTQDAARRESLEEALAEVEIGSLLAVVHVLHADQVHVMFRARLPKPEFGVGPESLEVMLCDEAGIPGRTSRSAAWISPCAATSRTAAPASSGTTSPPSTCARGTAR